MPVTRRSLLQTLGLLPAAFIAETQLTGCKFCPPFHPSPKSIFVLLEGPWLMFRKNAQDTTLTALTIGNQMDTSCFQHFCSVQTWSCGDLLSETFMDVQTWNITVSGFDVSTSRENIIKNAFTEQPFIWASGDTSGACQGQERVVKLPVPSRIYVGGLLKNASPSGPIEQGDKVKAHISTILEYAPQDESALQLILSTPTQTFTFRPPAHLVFRMWHWGPTGDAADVTQADKSFAFLLSRLPATGSQIQLGLKTNTDYATGKTDGIKDDELGLHHPDSTQIQDANRLLGKEKLESICGRVNNYSNCCGPTIVGGG